MPAKSKAQQRLMAAAAHGATFPTAQQLRASMPMTTLGDFARGSMVGKPERVTKASSSGHPQKNLGTFLHPKKR